MDGCLHCLYGKKIEIKKTVLNNEDNPILGHTYRAVVVPGCDCVLEPWVIPVTDRMEHRCSHWLRGR